MKRLALAALLLAPHFALAAEDRCLPVETATKGLAKTYGEHMAFMFAADTKAGTVAVTVFLNPDTKSVTLFSVSEDGTACEIVEGEGWKAIELPEPEPDGDPL